MNVNDYLMKNRDANDPRVRNDDTFPIVPRVKCADGFSFSVQASHGAYCSPRTNVGPWELVEVGFPSDTPHLLMAYAEEKDRPTDTVYGYVPVQLVDELIAQHGGMVPA